MARYEWLTSVDVDGDARTFYLRLPFESGGIVLGLRIDEAAGAAKFIAARAAAWQATLSADSPPAVHQSDRAPHGVDVGAGTVCYGLPDWQPVP
jgi:hypothetical protein